MNLRQFACTFSIEPKTTSRDKREPQGFTLMLAMVVGSI